MAQPKPSAAGALYPHLRSAAREPSTQRQPKSLADAMYPRPQAKPPNPYRDLLLRNLRELNAKGSSGRAKSNLNGEGG
jgi:hypothetical protein